jgi:hypothetical protein
VHLRERRLDEFAARAESEPQNVLAADRLSQAVSPAPLTAKGDTPASMVPDRTIGATSKTAAPDTSKDSRKWLNDTHFAVERYRLERACAKGVPIVVYMLFWFVEGLVLYRTALREPLRALETLHTISWYTCAVLLFLFSWLIPGQQPLGPVPGWVVQGVPAVLWGGGLATFCVIQLLIGLQRLGGTLPEYEEWILLCAGFLLFLGYLVPHTAPLSSSHRLGEIQPSHYCQQPLIVVW